MCLDEQAQILNHALCIIAEKQKRFEGPFYYEISDGSVLYQFPLIDTDTEEAYNLTDLLIDRLIAADLDVIEPSFSVCFISAM